MVLLPAASPRETSSRRDRRPFPPLLLVLVGAAIAALALVPLAYVVTYAVSLGPSAALGLLVRPRVGELLLNTVELLIGVVAASTVLGVGLRLAGRAHRPPVPVGVASPVRRRRSRCRRS